jgi:hypothetical protein
MQFLIWLIVLLLAVSLPAGAQHSYLSFDRIYSVESYFQGYSSKTYSGAMYGADTCSWIVWFGNDGLYPTETDFDFCTTIDTSLGALTDTTTATLTTYPIVASPAGTILYPGKDYKGKILWEFPINLTRRTTGASSASFAFSVDSTYVWHSSTWWSGMNVLGTLTRAVSTATDSFYWKEVWPDYLRQ